MEQKCRPQGENEMKMPKELKNFEDILINPRIDVNIQPVIYTLRILWNDLFKEDSISTFHEQSQDASKGNSEDTTHYPNGQSGRTAVPVLNRSMGNGIQHPDTHSQNKELLDKDYNENCNKHKHDEFGRCILNKESRLKDYAKDKQEVNK
jgi:hypothetical protein